MKIITISCSLILLSAINIYFVGCNQNNMQPQNEYGFIEKSQNGDISYRCAYKLPYSEFQKTEVFIDVYYGTLFPITKLSTQDIHLYFISTTQNSDYGDLDLKSEYLIKSITIDEFNKYECIGTTNENGQIQLNFSHHELLQIPKELFKEEQGIISFLLIEYDTELDTFGSGKSFNVDYNTEGNSVYLSIPSN